MLKILDKNLLVGILEEKIYSLKNWFSKIYYLSSSPLERMIFYVKEVMRM